MNEKVTVQKIRMPVDVFEKLKKAAIEISSHRGIQTSWNDVLRHAAKTISAKDGVMTISSEMDGTDGPDGTRRYVTRIPEVTFRLLQKSAKRFPDLKKREKVLQAALNLVLSMSDEQIEELSKGTDRAEMTSPTTSFASANDNFVEEASPLYRIGVPLERVRDTDDTPAKQPEPETATATAKPKTPAASDVAKPQPIEPSPPATEKPTEVVEPRPDAATPPPEPEAAKQPERPGPYVVFLGEDEHGERYQFYDDWGHLMCITSYMNRQRVEKLRNESSEEKGAKYIRDYLRNNNGRMDPIELAALLNNRIPFIRVTPQDVEREQKLEQELRRKRMKLEAESEATGS